MRDAPLEAPHEVAEPSMDTKIQGLVVLLYGASGFGKSTLLVVFSLNVCPLSELKPRPLSNHSGQWIYLDFLPFLRSIYVVDI
jgi:hypothetical protein